MEESSFLKSSMTLRQKRETLRKNDDGFKGSEEIQSLHVDGSREAGPSASRPRRIRPRGTRGGRGQQARQHQRREEGDRRPRYRTRSRTRFGVRLGDEVRNWQDSGDSGSIGAAC